MLFFVYFFQKRISTTLSRKCICSPNLKNRKVEARFTNSYTQINWIKHCSGENWHQEKSPCISSMSNKLFWDFHFKRNSNLTMLMFALGLSTPTFRIWITDLLKVEQIGSVFRSWIVLSMIRICMTWILDKSTIQIPSVQYVLSLFKVFFDTSSYLN